MKRDIISILFAILSLIVTVKWGFHTLILAYLALTVVAGAFFLATANYRRNMLLAKYAKQAENIYVASANKYDTRVRKRANEQRNLLEQSGCTDAWKSKGLRPPQVVEIYFGDAENVNESWDEFEIRRDSIIQEDRKKRHIYLNSLPDTDRQENRDWYITEILRQVT